VKVAKTYPSLLYGVSQAVPHARIPGQHEEQVNFWPDPVEGLVRRWGTSQLSTMQSPNVDLTSSRSFTHKYGGHEVLLILPTQGGSGVPLVAFDKTQYDTNPRRDIGPVSPGGGSPV
jgi:hypothetical protein